MAAVDLPHPQTTLDAPLGISLYSLNDVSDPSTAKLWAAATRRRIDQCLEAGLPAAAADVKELSRLLAATIIAVLQKQSSEQWQYLRSILEIVLPYSSILKNSSQLNHYAQRIVHQISNLEDQELATSILDLVHDIFSQSQGNTNHRMTTHPDETQPAKAHAAHYTANVENSFILPDGSDPYRTLIKAGDTQMKPQGISFGDLADAMPSVIKETVQYDAMWSEGLGLTAAALGTKLPHSKSKSDAEGPSRKSDPSWVQEEPLKVIKSKVKVPSPRKKTTLVSGTPLSGKEVVELFGKGRHLGEAQFIYLNKAVMRHFRPYELIEVPQPKADPEEHWMVSCFGILHKVKGQPAESMTLYDWHREAVLWSALTKIPFFKNYLVRKAFRRWRSNQRSMDFSSTRHRVQCSLLQAKPRFGTALLQISKLLQELQLLTLLPCNTNVCVTLSEFDFTVVKKYREGKLILTKFFKFCKMILDKTCEDSVEQLRFCEAQTKQDKAVFSKESLYVQKQKKEHREQNFAAAHDETSHLGNFVLLVDQLLVSHLLALGRANIRTFVEGSMAAGPQCKRDAFFTAKLIFTEHHTLTLFPPKEKFSDSLRQTINSIPALISECAKPVSELTSGLIPPIKDSDHNVALEPGTTPDPNEITVHLDEPNLPESGHPKKSKDNLGVATPPCCIPGLSMADLTVIGQGMVGQYNPLSQDNLIACLSQDERVTSSKVIQESLMDSAFADIDAFIAEHDWIQEIHRFVTTWTSDSARQWRRAQAFTIESQLGKIRDWTERVSSVERMFITDNALFLVDCESVQIDLVPRLNAAFRDLLDFTANDATTFAGAFTEEIKGVIADMKEKNPSVSAFADYAQQYNTYKNKMADLQAEVEYIKSLFEVIRLSCRSLSAVEEKHEEQVWQSWEAFLLQLQDAAEFVHVEMPNKTEEVDATYKHYMAKARLIHQEATGGIYLDPTQDSSALLTSLSKHFEDFHVAQSEVNKCSSYREKMMGQPFDTTKLSEMLSSMRRRAELWKYLESSSTAIKDWKLTVFKKFDVQKAIDKITDWQRSAGSLKQYLPQSDPVLAHWYRRLATFKQDLPLLLKLHSDSLKPRHWRAIFLAIGQTYDQRKSYRVMDLLSYSIAENSLAINNICAGAEAEYSLEKSMVKLRQIWDEKDLKIAKHITKGAENISSGEQDVFILIGVEELKYLLEDSQVTLQNMLVSPHLADLRPVTLLWRSTLSQVSEQVELIDVCQAKWLFLQTVFDVTRPSFDLKLIAKYETVNQKFQDVMTAIADDPKVLSLVNKRTSEKGYRELQGDGLKRTLQHLIQMQEQLSKAVDSVLTEARASYPRFYFLCDADLTAILAHPTDRKQWIPYISKLFPAITDVTLAMSPDRHSVDEHLDIQLHADQLEAVSFEGDYDDYVTLIHPVAPTQSVGAWWTHFEHSMKSTIGSMLNACLESRLQEGVANPGEILQELAKLQETFEDSAEGNDLKQAVRDSFTDWLLRFPIQCTLIADAVLWFRLVAEALQDSDRSALKALLSDINNSITQYASLLKGGGHVVSERRVRLHISNMIIHTLHHRDILKGLLKCEELGLDSFEWQKILKYSVDISRVQCIENRTPGGSQPTLTSQHVFSPCRIEQLGSSYPYDYEYIGPTMRLVATPLTDRCHLAMLRAIKQFSCGTISGPSSVGKKETLKELSKIMGRNLFIVDCLNITDIGVLDNVLNGLVQSGTWGVFHNVLSMDQGLLCIFAQCLKGVFSAYHMLSESRQRYTVEQKTKMRNSRRHSLTTLLPTEDGLERARSNREHVMQPKEPPRERRHSIVRDRYLSASEHYQESKQQVPLFRPKSASASPTPRLQDWWYEPRTLGHLAFTGCLIPASENFACFITMTDHQFKKMNIPSSLRAVMRPTSLVLPEISVILDTLLICSGFQEHQRLGAKLHSLSETLQAQFPADPELHFDLRVFRFVIDMAAMRLHSRRAIHQLTGTSQSKISNSGITSEQDDDGLGSILEEDELHKEENAILYALNRHLGPRLSDPDKQQQIHDLLRCIFPWGRGRQGLEQHDPILLDAIQNQFVTDKLQATPHHVNKVLELHQSLQLKRGVILVGSSGSGKSVCYQTLACVLNSLHQTISAEQSRNTASQTAKTKITRDPSSPLHRMKLKAEVISKVSLHWMDSVTKKQKSETYPAVNITVIHPTSLELHEIIGEWNAEAHRWTDGLVAKLLRDSAASESAANSLGGQRSEREKQRKPYGNGGLMGTPSLIQKWVVMDGEMNETLSEMLFPLTKNEPCLNLASGEQLLIPTIIDGVWDCSVSGIARSVVLKTGCLSLLIETTDISRMSPAMVAQCSVLHFGEDMVQWRLLLDSWMSEVKAKWDCSNSDMLLLSSMISETLPATVGFIGQAGCRFILDADQLSPTPLQPGVREIHGFIQIMSALLSLYFKRAEGSIDGESKAGSSPAGSSVRLSSIFVYAYVWGFGGSLHERYWDQFESFARQTLSGCSLDVYIPAEGSLFSYHICPSQGTLVPFDDRTKMLPSGYTVIPKIERYIHLVDLLLPHVPLLIVGSPGIGKSAFVQNMVHPKYPYTKVTFSASFTSKMFSERLLYHLQPVGAASLSPSTKTHRGTPRGKPTIFIDDLNCCAKNMQTGGHSNLTILRQLFSHGGFHQSVTYHHLQSFGFLGVCSPPSDPGSGGAALSPRLTRLMVALTLTSPDVGSVLAMYGSNLTSWLEEFPAYSLARHQDLSTAILSATVSLHGLVKRHLPCTPGNPQYMFSYHDLHHVISGLHLLSARSRAASRPKHGQRRVGGRKQSQGYHGLLPHSAVAPLMMRTVIRLWCHEITRTYMDRMTSAVDKDWFSSTLENTVQEFFCTSHVPPSAPVSIPEEHSATSLVESPNPPESITSESPDIAGDTANVEQRVASVSSVGLPSIRSPSVPPLNVGDVSGRNTTPVYLDREHDPLPPIVSGTEYHADIRKQGSISPETNHVPSRSEEGRSSPETNRVPSRLKEGRSSPETNRVPSRLKKERSSPETNRVSSRLQEGRSSPETNRVPSRSKEGRSSRGDRFSRRAVSFKSDLFGGPLITIDQLKQPDEKLTDIIMAKFIPMGLNESDKGYNEFSLSQLTDGLKIVQEHYNVSAPTKMNLAFFTEALCHIARLTRTLATPGGNALLVGQSRSVGRSSLVHLAAYAARCELVTCHPGNSASENQTRLRHVIKGASQLAGVNGKPAVLLVSSRLGELALQDVCSLMKEGSCPGLYTRAELTKLASQMLGGTKPATGSKLEGAVHNYLSRVQTYVHVIVSLDCHDGWLSSSKGFLQKFPALLQSSLCIDVYEPWSKQVYVNVARHWLMSPSVDSYTSRVIRPALSTPEQLRVSEAVAYIHRSAHQHLVAYHLADYHLYSPATFLDFIDLFKSLKWKILKEENLQIAKYQGGLDKVNEALERIESSRTELESLRPQYQRAVDIAHQKQQEVMLYKQEFDNAEGHCSQDESAITDMQKPLEEIKKKAQAELDRINPVYEAALHALRSLDSSALDEIRTFRKPPETVVKVVNALCLLFGEPHGWDSGKALINRDNFFQDLEFYDKSNMPEPIYHKLNLLFIQDDGFRPAVVARSSHAAQSLCMWIHAVFAYATIHRNMRPKITVVEQAEGKLHEAQSHLGQKRVKAQEVQGILEQMMAEYQQCIGHVNSLDKAIKAIEVQIGEASDLMGNIETQHILWRDSLEQAQSHLITSTGDALLVAASATYLGPMEQSARAALQADWMTAFKSGQFHREQESSSVIDGGSHLLPVRDNFSLRAILSSIDEQQGWGRLGCLNDIHTAQNALFIRACTVVMKRHWPLVLDPDDKAHPWIELLQERGLHSFHDGPDPTHDEALNCVPDGTGIEGSIDESISTTTLTDRADTPRTVASIGSDLLHTPAEVITPDPEDTIECIDVNPPLELMVAPSDDPTLTTKLRQAVVHGYTLVITHIERQPLGEEFREVLKRNVTLAENGQRRILIGRRQCDYNNKFKLILCSSVPLTLQGDGLKLLPLGDTILIDMSIGQGGLEDLLWKDVLSSERPEYINQLRSIQGDIREQMITINQAEEDILKKTVSLSRGILDDVTMSDSLLQYQQQIMSTEATLEESITLQKQLNERRKPFLLVAHHGALLYHTVRKMERVDPAYHVPLGCFLQWFSQAVRARQKDPSNIAAPRARAVELINSLTRDLHRWMAQWCPQGELFMFLLATDQMRDVGEVTEEEWKVFVAGVDLSSDSGGDEDDEKTGVDWIDDKTWTACHQLTSALPSFNGLTSSLCQHTQQWQEYFRHQPVLLSPVPGGELSKLSIFQKAILWRIVQPDKLASICRDVTVYQFGSDVYGGLSTLDMYLPLMTSRIPLVIQIPEGYCFSDPSSDIENLCTAHRGLEKNFHKVTLGTSSQLEDAARLLKDCQTNGHWLLLENCQTVQEWDCELLRVLEILLEGPHTESPHPSFRLILLSENSSKFPGILLKHSLKMSVSHPSSFTTCLQYNYNKASSWVEQKQLMGDDSRNRLLHEMVFSLSFFHTVLSQRLLYPRLGFRERYYWNEKDLYSSLEYLTSGEPVDLTGLEEFVGMHLYGGQTTNPEDLHTVQAIAESVLIPWRDVKNMPSSMGVGSYLASLLSCVGGSLHPNQAKLKTSLQLLFDSMKANVDPVQLGMAEGVAPISEKRQSRSVLETLQCLEMGPQPPAPPSSVVLLSQLSTMHDRLSTVSTPPARTDTSNHLESFIHSEIHLIYNKAQSILSDIHMLKGALAGDIYCNLDIDTMLQALSEDRPPLGWCYSDGRTKGVLEQVNDLLKRFSVLLSYSGRESRVLCYDIGAFVRPTMFMRAMLMEHARKEFMDVQDVSIDIQVIVDDASPLSQPPDTGVYVSGFFLHNALWDCNRLEPSSLGSGSGTCKLPMMWLKPFHRHYTSRQLTPTITYNCPVYEHGACRTAKPFMYLPLAVKPPKTWAAQRRVWATTGVDCTARTDSTVVVH